MAANSYFVPVKKISRGDVEAGFTAADHVVEGQVHMGSQEHFYMETQSVVVVPKGEDGEMEVFCSTQCANFTQVCNTDFLKVFHGFHIWRTYIFAN